jgi:type IV pilus assembly protein PilC
MIAGQLEGDSLTMVANKLRQMGYTVIELKEKSLAQKEINMPFGNKVKAKDLTIFSRQFSTMINAGLSLTKSLGILAAQTESKVLKKVISEVLSDVEQGKGLSEAMAKHKNVFPPIYVNMVKAGETGGVLDVVLMRVAEHFEKEAAIRSKVKSAMAYPMAMFTFSILITVVLIVFIVPIFVNMFNTMGGELPLPTKVLLMASNFLNSYWFIIIPALIGAFYAFNVYKKTKNGRHQVDAIKLKIPILGIMTKKMSVSRFTRTLGTLMASGVPILQALDIVADSSGNAIVSDAVKAARASIKEGETISKPLVGSKVFPPMVVQMIAVGEETGSLDAMLSKIADFYDIEVESMVEALTSIIEPLMIVVMGILIGGIIVSLYMPMFQIINLIH